MLDCKAIRQADRLQRDMRQLTRITGKDAQPAATPGQLPHQLHGTGSCSRGNRQVALVLQQPGMLGGRLRRR
ncbi:hypothetical protein D3C76_1478450 [compost metagenome]